MKRILIVDDLATNRELIREALMCGEYKITEAVDGGQALEIMKNEGADLVITDLRMPEISGLDLLRKLRVTYPHTTVILVTAWGTVGSAVEAMKAGAHDYITRPVDVQDLRSIVRQYLLTHRPQWRKEVAVGKTLVSSSMIDRVAKKLGRDLREVPVGFKWFVPRLVDGSYCFGGEESAGASFLRFNGTVWTTDKDGPIMDLLAAEITARTGKDPGEHYRELTAEFGSPYYTRIDAPASPEQKSKLQKLTPEAVKESDLAGEPITAKLTRAPGNNAPICGLKVAAGSGWFAARPSGTENIYKIYAESFKSREHLHAIVREAQVMVSNALDSPGFGAQTGVWQ